MLRIIFSIFLYEKMFKDIRVKFFNFALLYILVYAMNDTKRACTRPLRGRVFQLHSEIVISSRVWF